MERGTKRKSTTTATPDHEATAPKKIRLSAGSAEVSDTQLVERARDFLEQLKKAQDKTGRPVATEFSTLPDRKEMPEYYEQIRLPIAIDTIENKLNAGGYPNLTALESDVKRMVANAKGYNDKDSLIYADAERIRKMLSNYMVKHNPAYKDPNYIAQATPIPPELLNGTKDVVSTSTPKTSVAVRSRSTPQAATPGPRPEKSNLAPEQLLEVPDFSGLSFQQAQEKILLELIKNTEDDLEIYMPFVNLPPRSLTDYYQLIKNPVSLKAVHKKVIGQHGRSPPTGVTDYKSWDALTEDMSWVWRNAWEYNEDGSDISDLATQLKKHFERRLAAAKKKVSEPPQPSLKLKMGPSQPAAGTQSVKLRLGGQRTSPGPTSATPENAARQSSTPGMTVDAEALRRQKEHIQAGVNGQAVPQSAQRTSSTPRPSSAAPAPTAASQERSASAGSPPAAQAAVKDETEASPPQTNGVTATPQMNAPTGAMLPPAARPASVSPYPQPSQPSPALPTAPSYTTPATGLDKRFREKGQTAADALLPNLSISTHQSLRLNKPFHYNVRASSTLTQQSITLSLPSTHYFLQLCPTVAADVHKNRPYKLFVTVNNQRLGPVPSINGVALGGPAVNGLGSPLPKAVAQGKTSVYEARLAPGVNRVEVEVVAGLSNTREPRKKGEPEIEGEKISAFVNLMR